jgi:hypothetical protein
VRVLSVSAIRRHLYWTGGGPDARGAGAPSTALLGQIFHDLYGALTGTDAQKNLAAPLELADASVGAWQTSLIDHAFGAVIAPALARHEYALQSHGAEVLGFWTAVRELCGWLAGLMHDQRAADATRSLEAVRRLVFADAEVDLDVEMTDPGWPEPVRLQGRADAVLMRRGDGARCLIELKLGRTHPEADLLQGCLYHLMLATRSPALAGSALGLISFEPQRHEQVFEADRLLAAQDALRTLIGELAGFSAGNAAAPPASAAEPASASPAASAPVAGSAPVAAASPIAAVPAAGLAGIRDTLIAAFTEYGAPLSFADEVLCGPSFIRFHATPQRGVSVTRLARLAANVWMRIGTMQSPQVSLQRGRIAIDVERPDRQPVNFSEWRALLPAVTSSGSAQFAIGVRVDGTLAFADLSASQSPHLLVAGTTGSGKSEWLRAFLASMLAQNTPATLRLALIDPKRLAFAALEQSAFLWEPVVHEDGAIALLDRLIDEMERRYVLLQQAGADDLARYNAQDGAGSREACPRLVCVCDEFADLILRDKASRAAVEERVARIGVKGRAAGIHLVFATQRAGREVLKGTIDANLPARVALAVARKIDSRLVLGEAGAESLLGRGDLLYKDIGEPVRIQGLLVTREELAALGKGPR